MQLLRISGKFTIYFRRLFGTAAGGVISKRNFSIVCGFCLCVVSTTVLKFMRQSLKRSFTAKSKCLAVTALSFHCREKLPFCSIEEEKLEGIFPHYFYSLVLKVLFVFFKSFCLTYVTFWKLRAVSDMSGTSGMSVSFFMVCTWTTVHLLGGQMRLWPTH